MVTNVEVASLQHPIDVMYLIHKALSAEARKVEKVTTEIEVGGSLQAFKLAFNNWATNLMFHAEQEDLLITEPLEKSLPDDFGNPKSEDGLVQRIKAAMLAQEDQLHEEMIHAIEDVFETLNGEIGRTSIITRTKQHLYSNVIALSIAQQDHLDTEEALVLPLAKERLTEQQQLEAAKGLLIDDMADDSRWVLNWVAEALTPTEQELLYGLEIRFQEV